MTASPSFAAALALSAFFDTNVQKVKFIVKLLNAGVISGSTKALSFFVKVDDTLIEKELNSIDLLSLVTDKDQTSIAFELAVVAKAPVDLVYWAIEQTTSGEDIDVSLVDAAACIKIFGKPGPLFIPEISNKALIDGTNANTVKLTAALKFILPDNNGGIDLRSYSYSVICGNVRTAVNNTPITAADIKNKYVIANLAQDNLKDGTAVAIAYAVDNLGGEQSFLSPVLKVIATTKPGKCTFELESGKIDDVANVYIPIKFKVDIFANNWTYLHICQVDPNDATKFIAVKSLQRDSEKMDDQMNAKNFVEYKFKNTTSGGVDTPLTPLTKYELFCCVGNASFDSNGKAVQSLLSDKATAVTALKKYDFLSTVTSTYTAPSGNTEGYHTFTNTITGFTAPVALGFAAFLLQNGNEIASKTVSVSTGATSVVAAFDVVESLVKPTDNFKINFVVKTHLTDAISVYLKPNTTLNGRNALIVAARESDIVVPKPKTSDVGTALLIKSVDDIKATSGVRKLLIDLGLLRRTDLDPYQIKQLEIEVSENQDFAQPYFIDANKATKLIVAVSANNRNLAETIILTKYIITTPAQAQVGTPAKAAVGQPGDPNYQAAVAASTNPAYQAAVSEVVDAVDISASLVLYIRARHVVYWKGSGNNTLNLPWVYIDYKTSEIDSIPALAIPIIKQINSNNVKVEFDRAVDATWTGAIADGDTSFKPVSTLLTLNDELGRELATKIIIYDALAPAKLSHIFDVAESQLDQFVSVSTVVKYRNAKGIVTLSDKSQCAELFLAKKLMFKSIQTVETADKIKMIVAIEFGRQLISDIKVQAVLPHKDSNNVLQTIALLDWVASEKRFVFEGTKQEDLQNTKYGKLAKYYVFASDSTGNLVGTGHPL